MSRHILFSSCAAALVCAVAGGPIVLDGNAVAFTYDGIGGLSAGASSRLLWDYPPEIASDILDFLYLPKHGAALAINKVGHSWHFSETLACLCVPPPLLNEAVPLSACLLRGAHCALRWRLAGMFNPPTARSRRTCIRETTCRATAATSTGCSWKVRSATPRSSRTA